MSAGGGTVGGGTLGGGMMMDVSEVPGGTLAGPTLLEQRYRGLLRVLPRAYRERWAEDMADTFLDVRAEAVTDGETFALGRLGAPDVVDVLALSVRLRLRALRLRLDPPAADARTGWGAGLRALAAATLVVHAVLGLLAVGGALWMADQIPWLPQAPPEWQAFEGTALSTGSWAVLSFLAPLAWLVAFVSLVCGRVSSARWWACAALLPFAFAAGRALAVTAGLPVAGLPWSARDWAMAAVWLLPLLGLVAFHDGAAPLRRGTWAGALVAGVVGVHVLLLLTPHQVIWLDDVGMVCAAAVAAGLVHLGLLVAGRASAAGTSVVALLVGYAFVLRAASLVLHLRGLDGIETIRTAVYVEAAAALALAGALALLAARSRRVPHCR